MSVDKLNTIAITSIEKVNSKTDANIESINGITFAGYSALSWGTATSISTATQQMTSAGTTSASLVMGGSDGSSQLDASQEWNGSSWGAGGDLSSARDSSGGCGTQTAALDCGGYISGDESQTTEEYNGTSFSGGGNMVVGSYGPTVFGTQTAAVWCGGKKFGGDAATFITNSEQYNGTAWTAHSGTNDLDTGIEGNAGGAGTQSAGLIFGGNISGPAHTDKTQIWNGTTWSAGNDMAAVRRYNSGFGTSTRAWTQGGTSAHGSSYVTLASTETFDGTNWSSDTNIPKNVGLHSHGCHVGSARTGFIVGGYERDSSGGSGAALVATHFQAS